jgi:hypothetical protein
MVSAGPESIWVRCSWPEPDWNTGGPHLNQDQWIGRLEVAIGAATERLGSTLRSVNLETRGARLQARGHARARYGGAVAAVARRWR